MQLITLNEIRFLLPEIIVGLLLGIGIVAAL
jgi:hypothetical protein